MCLSEKINHILFLSVDLHVDINALLSSIIHLLDNIYCFHHLQSPLKVCNPFPSHFEITTPPIHIHPKSSIMKRAELVCIPLPGAGHLFSMLEFAKLLVERDDRLSITILIMNLPFDSKVTPSTESLSASTATNRINFIRLHHDSLSDTTSRTFFISFIESHKSHVKEAVTNLSNTLSASHSSPRLAGFVLDMFCTTMIDIADEFGVPSYVFYTSSAAFLGFILHVQALYDEQNKSITELKDSNAELPIPSLVNPIPAKCLPSVLPDKDWFLILCEQARRIRSVKGVMVNSFRELESPAMEMEYFSDEKRKNRLPTVYPVGPILNLKVDNNSHGTGGSTTKSEIMEWLDDQPESSVVFLCFGSMGSFGADQVKEIAHALEESGHRFLWSLRQPPPQDQFPHPIDYANPRDVLPEGFLERTAGIGKIIGWAPQVLVLAHKSIGGFVSHCGWNSTLESIWFGVPIATWPLHSEQQFNACQLVVELGLGVEIKMDYRKDFYSENHVILSAEEIERGIRKLMENDGKMRRRMKEMSQKSRRAVMDGGSSFSSVGCFIGDVMDNMP